MTALIALPQADLAIVRAILRDYLPDGTRAWVFGSRATATARPSSDLDLALEWDRPLGLDRLGQVAEVLSESDLPCKVDVLDLHSIDPAFRSMIEAHMIPLPF